MSNDIKFDWDEIKAAANKKKHGVTFEEAVTVFYDENALEFHDPDHSKEEDRFILVGLSFKVRALIVCYCARESDSVIRIFSARKATKRETERYWEEQS